MKVTRKMLLLITGALGVLIILYSLFRHFTGKGLSEAAEKYMMDVVVIAALGLFLYNRKMAKDERLAREEAEEKARRIAEGLPEEPEPVEENPDDNNLPHWLRHKKDEDLDDPGEPEDAEETDTEEYEDDGEYKEGGEDDYDPRR